MASDWDHILEPSDGQVFLGCKPHEPSRDATCGRRRPDGTHEFLPRARRVKSCHCGSGRAGFVQPGTALVCEACSKSGQDYKLPRVVAPLRGRVLKLSKKASEGGKPLTRRQRRALQFGRES